MSLSGTILLKDFAFDIDKWHFEKGRALLTESICYHWREVVKCVGCGRSRFNRDQGGKKADGKQRRRWKCSNDNKTGCTTTVSNIAYLKRARELLGDEEVFKLAQALLDELAVIGGTAPFIRGMLDSDIEVKEREDEDRGVETGSSHDSSSPKSRKRGLEISQDTEFSERGLSDRPAKRIRSDPDYGEARGNTNPFIIVKHQGRDIMSHFGPKRGEHGQEATQGSRGEGDKERGKQEFRYAQQLDKIRELTGNLAKITEGYLDRIREIQNQSDLIEIFISGSAPEQDRGDPSSPTLLSPPRFQGSQSPEQHPTQSSGALEVESEDEGLLPSLGQGGNNSPLASDAVILDSQWSEGGKTVSSVIPESSSDLTQLVARSMIRRIQKRDEIGTRESFQGIASSLQEIPQTPKSIGSSPPVLGVGLEAEPRDTLEFDDLMERWIASRDWERTKKIEARRQIREECRERGWVENMNIYIETSIRGGKAEGRQREGKGKAEGRQREGKGKAKGRQREEQDEGGI